ncbi:hypothetical protein [Pedobacter jamesrossensis]|uniref:Cupin domain-containing protein n=1 Tax=Pedobacter jamesrossensis TaxID=1908238 RepID=A0ABV8NPE5_9SPHI
MKTTFLIIGLLIGGLLGFGLTKYFNSNNSKELKVISSKNTVANWNWADSLESVKNAPSSHKIVYEDSKVRVLQVILQPKTVEPIHTHQFKSIMWFTKATPMTYYQYNLSKSGKYEITDSIKIGLMPAEVLNHGEIVEPEKPHAVKNTGSETGIAYRIEFKKDF